MKKFYSIALLLLVTIPTLTVAADQNKHAVLSYQIDDNPITVIDNFLAGEEISAELLSTTKNIFQQMIKKAAAKTGQPVKTTILFTPSSSSKLPDFPPLCISTIVDEHGRNESNFSIGAYLVEEKDTTSNHGTMEWDSASGNASFDDEQWRNLSASLDFPHFRIQIVSPNQETVGVDLQGIKIDTSFGEKLIPNRLKMEISNLSFISKEEQDVELNLKNFSIAAEKQENITLPPRLFNWLKLVGFDYKIPPYTIKINLPMFSAKGKKAKTQEFFNFDLQGLVLASQLNDQLIPMQFDLQLPLLQMMGNMDNNKFDLNIQNHTMAFTLYNDYLVKTFDLQLPFLKASVKEGSFNVKNISSTAKVEEVNPNLRLGNANFQIGQLFFQADKKEVQFSLEGFNFDNKAIINQDVINYTNQSQIDGILLPKEADPELGGKLISYSSTIEFHRIDTKVIEEVQKTAREIQKMALEGNTSQEFIGMIAMGKLLQVVPLLLRKSPEISMNNFVFKVGNDSVNGSLTVSIDGSKPIELSNSQAFLNALRGQAAITIPETFLQGIFKNRSPDNSQNKQQATQAVKKQIQELVDQNWLQKAENGTYKAVAQLKNGQLTVNGKPVALPLE